MIVSISQFSTLAHDLNGRPMPLGKDRIACQVRTTAGAFTALNALTRFIRIATDTAIHMDVTGGATTSADEYFPAGSVEYLPVNGSEVLTIAAA